MPIYSKPTCSFFFILEVKTEICKGRQIYKLFIYGIPGESYQKHSTISCTERELMVIHIVPPYVRRPFFSLNTVGYFPSFLRSKTEAHPSHFALNTMSFCQNTNMRNRNKFCRSKITLKIGENIFNPITSLCLKTVSEIKHTPKRIFRIHPSSEGTQWAASFWRSSLSLTF